MTRTPLRERETISWLPVWGKEHEKWSRGFVRAHKWRVDRLHTEDDLVQEAWITFNYVANAYPRCICPDHFMAMFKRAMVNKMHDRSCRHNRRRDTVEAPISTDVYEVFAGRIGEISNSGYINILLNEAPEELKLVMALLAEGKLDARSVSKEGRENFSIKARKFLNKKGVFNAFAYDPIAEIKQLFA